MQKNLFGIISTFIIIASLFCGCEVNKNQDIAEIGEASEFGEFDMPWGECNYKKTGVIKDLEKDLDDNITTAVFTIAGEDTVDSVKIYGTDMNIDDYEGKTVFISAVKNKHVSEEYVLVKRYEDINLENLELIDSIKSLDSLENSKDLSKVQSKIEMLENQDYRNYIIGVYNTKIKELSEKKKQEDKAEMAYEETKSLVR